jgi:hypothetical protein
VRCVTLAYLDFQTCLPTLQRKIPKKIHNTTEVSCKHKARPLFQKHFLPSRKEPPSIIECHVDKTEEKPMEEKEPYDVNRGFIAPDTCGATGGAVEPTAPKNPQQGSECCLLVSQLGQSHHISPASDGARTPGSGIIPCSHWMIFLCTANNDPSFFDDSVKVKATANERQKLQEAGFSRQKKSCFL